MGWSGGCPTEKRADHQGASGAPAPETIISCGCLSRMTWGAMMLVGVMSDTHDNLPAVELAVQKLKQREML